MATILCVDDDASVCAALEGTLRRAGHTPIVTTGVPDALNQVAKGGIDLIISDYQMPGFTGIEFLALLETEGFDIPLIMLTGYASIDHAVAAVKAGATDYIQKPFERELLELAVAQALAHASLRRENEALRRQVTDLRQRTGEHPVIAMSIQLPSDAHPDPGQGEAGLVHADATQPPGAGGTAGTVAGGSGTTTAPDVPPGAVVLTTLDVGEAEQALITRALSVTGGNRTHAAKLLGISVRTLRNKLNLRSAAVSTHDNTSETPSD